MTHKLDLEYHKYSDLEIKKALVMLSFPTIGKVGNICANFLIKNLDLELVGAFTSDEFHPAAIVHKGKPTPPVRIFAGKHKCGPEDECDQLVVITSDLPIDKKVLAPLADHIIEWCKDNNSEIITTIEGVNKEDMDLGSEVNVYTAASNDDAAGILEGLEDVEPLEKGMVSGLSGVLLYKGHLQDYPISSILADAHKNFPDSRSAARVLEVLNKLLPGIEMDPQPLREQAEAIEEQIRESLSQIRQDQDQDKPLKATQGFFA